MEAIYREGRITSTIVTFQILSFFGCYFLLCASELQLPILRRWEAKFAIAFLIPSIAETCQYFGIPVLGSTSDPLDYFMYGIGALSAAVVDVQVFPQVFDFWTMEKAER